MVEPFGDQGKVLYDEEDRNKYIYKTYDSKQTIQNEGLFLRGLVNHNDTEPKCYNHCYQNAMFQALLSFDDFVDGFKTFEKTQLFGNPAQ